MKNLFLLKNFSIIGIFHLLTNVIQLLVLFYLAKNLGANDFGVYILIITVSSIIYLVSDYGLSWSSTRYIAQHKKDKFLISNKFWSTWCTQIFINITIALTTVALINLSDSSEYKNNLIYYGLLVSFSLILNPIWLFNGIENSKIYSIPPAITKLLSAPLYMILIKSSNDLSAAIFLTAGTNFFTCTITLFFTYKQRLILSPKLENLFILRTITEGYIIFAAKLSISIKDYIFPLIITSLLGTQSLGLFSIAEKIKTAAVSLTTPLSLTLFPRMSDLAKNDMNLFLKTIKQSSLIIILTISPLCYLIFTFADTIIDYTVGNAYQDSAAALKWLSGLPLIITINNILGMQILISRGHEKIFTISHSISLIFGISIAFIIIPINNIIGASQLLIVTELIAMFLLAIGVHYSKNQS